MDPVAFDIRPVSDRDDDLRAVTTAMALLAPGPGSIKDLRALRSTMRQVLHLVAWVDGRPVGFGFAGTWPGGETGPLLEADIGVDPSHRRNGVGSALLRSLAHHARELGKETLQFEVFDDRPESLDFLLHRGFTEVGRELQFELDLDMAVPSSVEPPEGVEVVTRAQHPELVQGMYEVALDAIPDIPGSEGEGPSPFEDWHAFEIERPNHLPEMCFLAVHQGEVVGSATLQVFEDTAHHGGTLVKRAWRRRGVARALTLRQVAAAREAGFRLLHCETEARNEPMRRLLRQLGYRPLPSVVVMRGSLDPKRIVAGGYDRMGIAFSEWNDERAPEARRWFLAEVLARLGEGSDVLELGCGPGTDAAALSADRRYVGVDLSEGQLSLARRRVPDAAFVLGDFTSMAFRPASFDGVVGFYVFNHVSRDDVEPAFARIFEWLRPGGRLMTSLLTTEAEDRVEEWLDVPMFFAGVEPESYDRSLRNVGFDLELSEIHTEMDVRYGRGDSRWVIARKPDDV